MKKNLLLLCLCLSYLPCLAQLTSGDWLLAGKMEILSTTGDHAFYRQSGDVRRSLTVAPRLGVAIKERWLFGGSTGMGLAGRRGWMYNQLFARYRFFRSKSIAIYAGISLQRYQMSVLSSAGNTTANRTFEDHGEIQAQLWYWLHPGIAIEASMSFQMYNRLQSSIRQRRVELGELSFFLQPQFFVSPSKGNTTIANFESRKFWTKGRRLSWFLLALNSPQSNAAPNRGYGLIHLDLERAWFLRDRFLVGGIINMVLPRNYLSFDAQLKPFVRYYWPLQKGYALFSQIGTAYQFEKRNGFFFLNQKKFRQIIDIFAGAGYSKIIRPNLSFDVKCLLFYGVTRWNENEVNYEIDFGLQYSWQQ